MTDCGSKNIKLEDDAPSSTTKESHHAVSKPGSWYWLLAPDGSHATVENTRPALTTTKKEETTAEPVKSYHGNGCNPNSISRNETRDPKRGSWYWLLAADGSPAMVDVDTKPPPPPPRVARKRRREAAFERESAASRPPRRYSTDTDTKKEAVPKKEAGNVKSEKKKGSWYWLLAADGSYSVSSPLVARNHRGIKQNPAESTPRLSCHETCIEEDNEDEFGVEDECWSETSLDEEDYHNETTCDEDVYYSNHNVQSSSYSQTLHAKWKTKFQLLVEYQKKHKTTNVNTATAGLGRWVSTQRYCYKKGKLSKERIASLESIGFQWQLQETTDWMEMYDCLVEYKRKHKTTNVNTATAGLGKWVGSQRYCYKKGKLSKERIAFLESIGFQWQLQEHDWMEMYDCLVEYKRKHKTTNVNTHTAGLGKWVGTQRYCYKKGKLSKERISFLESIGFQWQLKEHHDWIEM